MTRIILIRAVLTGAFCSVFAVVVDMLLDHLTIIQLMITATISGFCGSLFAHLVLRPTSETGDVK